VTQGCAQRRAQHERNGVPIPRDPPDLLTAYIWLSAEVMRARLALDRVIPVQHTPAWSAALQLVAATDRAVQRSGSIGARQRWEERARERGARRALSRLPMPA